jgi:hypothetical protein
MKTIKHKILVALAWLLLAGLPATANLFQATDSNFGLNSLTIDTTTGLGWLDLTASAGLSYQQVVAGTQPGGVFSGFRFATAQEVLGLYTSAGIPGTGVYPASDPSIQSLISLVGATSFQDGHTEAIGISGTSHLGGQVVSSLDFHYRTGVPTYSVSGVPEQSLVYSVNTSFPTVGSWLVSSVPEPASASIYLLAVTGLIGFRVLQRKQNAA